MIIFVEPISNHIGMYVPAYPLPLLEIASFVRDNEPDVELRVMSIPVDYGLPVTRSGKEKIYREVARDLCEMKPVAVGISCTAIAQAGETITLCERIKAADPDIFIFIGGYFPTLYAEEILSRTTAVDLIVAGEGEVATLEIVRLLERGKDPRRNGIPNLVWRKGTRLRQTEGGVRFDLKRKSLLRLELLNSPDPYDILPYAFSRGCPHRCSFCMEEYLRPKRLEVPRETAVEDLSRLIAGTRSRTLVAGDALFKSFDLFPFFRSQGVKIHLETRCDGIDPGILEKIADACGLLAFGFESASYGTLKRMNKVRNREQFERYIANTMGIFKAAAKSEIPVALFMIAGFPGDTVEDLEANLVFAKTLSKLGGAGGHIIKIGECHAYPKTKVYELAASLDGVEFDDDGVFGQNIVRKPSRDVDFDTVIDFTRQTFECSNLTPKLHRAIRRVMPFFRLPAPALRDSSIPGQCFHGSGRHILSAHREDLKLFRQTATGLIDKYRGEISDRRSSRKLSI